MALGGGGGYGVLASGDVYSPGHAVLQAQSSTCPDGQKKVKQGTLGYVCPPAQGAAAGTGGLSITGGLPGVGAGAGGAAWTPSAVERPDLSPINPSAAYDPEIAKELASQRAYTGDLKAGTGFAQDVQTTQQRDAGQARMREAEQAAAQMGIPFDKAKFLQEQLRGENAAAAQLTLGREQMVGQSLGQEANVAQGQAGERDTRLGQDIQAQTTTNAQKLERYGTDVQKYGVDANASVAANKALMDFFGQLYGSSMSAIGSMGASLGGSNFSQSNVYGGY